ncbi:hypothetical protein NA56DRAFT_724655 [Hyaloscypha hepaticicola]|uniref:Uncharacterized protein n=1 Tax=Hyaloscypha hepaticicola TaxID=2082293 RepID=A0A2J6PZK1_9HELO|nr:hypothetical protein NA56DRAFT_724655 [Hyaloscypha hepaticicola]
MSWALAYSGEWYSTCCRTLQSHDSMNTHLQTEWRAYCPRRAEVDGQRARFQFSSVESGLAAPRRTSEVGLVGQRGREASQLPVPFVLVRLFCRTVAAQWNRTVRYAQPRLALGRAGQGRAGQRIERDIPAVTLNCNGFGKATTTGCSDRTARTSIQHHAGLLPWPEFDRGIGSLLHLESRPAPSCSSPSPAAMGERPSNRIPEQATEKATQATEYDGIMESKGMNRIIRRRLALRRTLGHEIA